MKTRLAAALERALGGKLRSSRRVTGGDINRAFSVELVDGRHIFVKTNADAPLGLFETEAKGLAWLAKADALPVPEVLAVGTADTPFLALEWIESTPRASDFDQRLGHGLALLHSSDPGSFGLDHTNFVGTVPQDNRPLPDWADFYAQRRLEPLFEEAAHRDLLPASVSASMARVLARLPELVGDPEPACRLHGDLWGGNIMSSAQGTPVLIDPAACGGHREVDLAMMRLFGGFSERVFDAYEAVAPLASGHLARVALYQLYPLLVHVLLFGDGYATQLGDTARAALSA